MDVFIVAIVTLWLILSIKIPSLIPPDFVLQITDDRFIVLASGRYGEDTVSVGRGRDGRMNSRCMLERSGINGFKI